jgi:hypothetical protein
MLQRQNDDIKIGGLSLERGVLASSPTKSASLSSSSSASSSADAKERDRKFKQRTLTNYTPPSYPAYVIECRFGKWFDLASNDLIRDMRLVLCIRSNTGFLIVTDNDKVYGIGNNGHGHLGLGHNSQVYSFQEVKTLSNKSIIDIRCGCSNYFTVVLSSSGNVWTCGYNGYVHLFSSTLDLSSSGNKLFLLLH